MKFLLALLFALTMTTAHADQATPAQLSPEDQAEVDRIGVYLNDITTAKADFLQTAPNGMVAGGTFYLSRPGKLRFDYVQPNKDIIVADGSSIWYYDSKLKDASTPRSAPRLPIFSCAARSSCRATSPLPTSSTATAWRRSF